MSPKKPTSGKGKKLKKPLTSKQRKLLVQLPDVARGKKTKADAMRAAGYKESSVDQASAVFGSLRVNTAMQDALKKAGFTEDYLAKGVVEGTKAASVGMTGRKHPDFRARAQFYKLGAELMDAFPAQKQITIPATIDDLIKKQEGGDTLAA